MPPQFGVMYHGKSDSAKIWACFITGQAENAEYTVTAEDLNPGSAKILCYLFDESGSIQKPSVKNNSNVDGMYVEAKDDGATITGMFNTLFPDTAYYLRLNCGSKTEYLFTIGAPEPNESCITIEKEPSQEGFPAAFELNETQVRFVADEAIFVDADAAASVLSNVAEIILAHPGQPILLAGTTAHGQSQERCVDLSFRRAEAVKELLTEQFSVPADQLLTVGLGFENDPFIRGGTSTHTEISLRRRLPKTAGSSP
ncbi:MAG: OmpA family protein [Oscillospiraceae bacterium]|nr:OmpA family protein [Oscillospiraceae bacterium]